MNEGEVLVTDSSKTGIRAFLAGIAGLLTSPENNRGPMRPSLERMVGRHHPGPVGGGHCGHCGRKRASQRERSNRRSAKRSAKARRA